MIPAQLKPDTMKMTAEFYAARADGLLLPLWSTSEQVTGNTVTVAGKPMPLQEWQTRILDNARNTGRLVIFRVTQDNEDTYRCGIWNLQTGEKAR
jgi:hypothetical protein